MKDGGYIFNCTPCGHAHAGECPPKAPPAASAAPVDPLAPRAGDKFRFSTRLIGLPAGTGWVTGSSMYVVTKTYPHLDGLVYEPIVQPSLPVCYHASMEMWRQPVAVAGTSAEVKAVPCP